MTATYRHARWLFLRLLGIIYLIAFVSLGVQVLPLLGSQGLLPAADVLAKPDQLSWLKFISLRPTLFHLQSSDAILQAGTWIGALIAILLIFDIAPAICALLLWLLYLSYVTAAQDFLSFQWDNLLLEAGVLAIFLAPWYLRPRWPVTPGGACATFDNAGTNKDEQGRTRTDRTIFDSAELATPSRVLIFLFQFLIFRLNFESGLSKLVSGDVTWRNLTAMDYYYETAPLPTRFGWYMHHLPHGFHAFEVVATFIVELGISWFVFGPRLLRVIAFFPLFGLQLVIGSTANYGFFNYLSAALLVFLIDDSIFGKIFAQLRRIRKRSPDPLVSFPEEAQDTTEQTPPDWKNSLRSIKQAGLVCAAILYVFVAYAEFARAFLPGTPAKWPKNFQKICDSIEPFRAINRYHLFATMTTERYELEIQGSDDGQNWETYEFRHKAGDPKRAPDFVAPHQPRLDFQNWFLLIRRGEIEQYESALRNPRYVTALAQHEPFFANLLIGLMKDSPGAKSFFAIDPFPGRAPAYLRVRVYRYTMASMAERREQGVYWNRKLIAEWGPLKKG